MTKQNLSTRDGLPPGGAERRAALRVMALAKLAAAQRPENALPTRIDIAAESCYMFALSLLDGLPIARRIPDMAVFSRVARQLGWEQSVFNLDPLRLWFRLFPTYHPGQLTVLIALAERLRDAEVGKVRTERNSESKQDIN